MNNASEHRDKALEALREAEYQLGLYAIAASKESGSWVEHDRAESIAGIVSNARKLLKQ